MFKINHNDASKQFMQKILIFTDTIFVNAANANSEDANKILATGLLNIRDAIFSEVVRDSHLSQLNQAISQEELKKKENLESKEVEEEKDSNQENKSDIDQKA